MAQVLYEDEETAPLRPDVTRAPLGNADALANAPVSGAGYYKVPLVARAMKDRGMGNGSMTIHRRPGPSARENLSPQPN